MVTIVPSYLLFSHTRRSSHPEGERWGRWHFVLQDRNGGERLEASHMEPGVSGERLDLLAVIRGLEALDQPSRVTLVTSSRYVQRGFRFGIAEWRENDWRWERYGEYTVVKNVDLWQRIDRAMQFHQVQCRSWRRDAAPEGSSASSQPPLSGPHFLRRRRRPSPSAKQQTKSTNLGGWAGRLAACQNLAEGNFSATASTAELLAS